MIPIFPFVNKKNFFAPASPLPIPLPKPSLYLPLSRPPPLPSVYPPDPWLPSAHPPPAYWISVVGLVRPPAICPSILKACSQVYIFSLNIPFRLGERIYQEGLFFPLNNQKEWRAFEVGGVGFKTFLLTSYCSHKPKLVRFEANFFVILKKLSGFVWIIYHYRIN